MLYFNSTFIYVFGEFVLTFNDINVAIIVSKHCKSNCFCYLLCKQRRFFTEFLNFFNQKEKTNGIKKKQLSIFKLNSH